MQTIPSDIVEQFSIALNERVIPVSCHAVDCHPGLILAGIQYLYFINPLDSGLSTAGMTSFARGSPNKSKFRRS